VWAQVSWAASQDKVGVAAVEPEHQVLRATADLFDAGDQAVGDAPFGQPGLDHAPVDGRVHKFGHEADGTRHLHWIAMQMH
jgi:hypothetical protein